MTHTPIQNDTHTQSKTVNSIDQKISNERMLAQLNLVKVELPSPNPTFCPLVPFPMCEFDAEFARRMVLTGVEVGVTGRGITVNRHAPWPFFLYKVRSFLVGAWQVKLSTSIPKGCDWTFSRWKESTTTFPQECNCNC